MSLIKADNLAKRDGSLQVPVETVSRGAAKAWVNFDGTGTVTIRQAFNVVSITDNGAGHYTINFASALVDANYVVVGGGNQTGSSGSTNMSTHIRGLDASGMSTTACVISSGTPFDGVERDRSVVCVAIYR